MQLFFFPSSNFFKVIIHDMILGYNMQGNLNQIFTLKLISSFSGLLWSFLLFFFFGFGEGGTPGGGGGGGYRWGIIKGGWGHKKAEVVIYFV